MPADLWSRVQVLFSQAVLYCNKIWTDATSNFMTFSYHVMEYEVLRSGARLKPNRFIRLADLYVALWPPESKLIYY